MNFHWKKNLESVNTDILLKGARKIEQEKEEKKKYYLTLKNRIGRGLKERYLKIEKNRSSTLPSNHSRTDSNGRNRK